MLYSSLWIFPFSQNEEKSYFVCTYVALFSLVPDQVEKEEKKKQTKNKNESNLTHKQPAIKPELTSRTLFPSLALFMFLRPWWN